VSRVFVDTSAFLALGVASDSAHERAVRAFEGIRARRETLVTSSYVLVETYALLARRHGLEAVRVFRDTMAPLLGVVWVEATLHDRGLDLMLKLGKRAVSLVDTVSFLVIRDHKLDVVFAYDGDFEEQGFPLVD
jgi:predicted nucleic acid-binding protein